jgi:hypothetical protein
MVRQPPIHLVVHSYHHNQAHWETPFFLVYGAEAVLPTDVKFGSPRVLAFNEIHQEDLIKDRLLQLEEARCQAALCVARYQQGLRSYNSRNV